MHIVINLFNNKYVSYLFLQIRKYHYRYPLPLPPKFGKNKNGLNYEYYLLKKFFLWGGGMLGDPPPPGKNNTE